MKNSFSILFFLLLTSLPEIVRAEELITYKKQLVPLLIFGALSIFLVILNVIIGDKISKHTNGLASSSVITGLLIGFFSGLLVGYPDSVATIATGMFASICIGGVIAVILINKFYDMFIAIICVFISIFTGGTTFVLTISYGAENIITISWLLFCLSIILLEYLIVFGRIKYQKIKQTQTQT